MWDDADLFADGVDGEVADVTGVESYATRGRVVETEEESEDGGFAAAGFADEGGGGAREGGEGEGLERWAAPVVGEVDRVEGDVAGAGGERDGVRGVNDGGLLFEL